MMYSPGTFPGVMLIGHVFEQIPLVSLCVELNVYS